MSRPTAYAACAYRAFIVGGVFYRVPAHNIERAFPVYRDGQDVGEIRYSWGGWWAFAQSYKPLTAKQPTFRAALQALHRALEAAQS